MFLNYSFQPPKEPAPGSVQLLKALSALTKYLAKPNYVKFFMVSLAALKPSIPPVDPDGACYSYSSVQTTKTLIQS